MFSIRETMADINVLQDLFPTMELAGDIVPDLLRLRDERIWMNSQVVPAGVGVSARVFYGGLPPGTISCIRHIIAAAGSAGNLTADFTSGQGGAGFTSRVQRTDGRDVGPVGATQVSQETGASAGGSIFQIPLSTVPLLLPNVNLIMTDKASDAAGSVRNLLFTFTTVNVQLQFTVFGYERAIEPSEVRS